jgi:hypothetical protein
VKLTTGLAKFRSSSSSSSCHRYHHGLSAVTRIGTVPSVFLSHVPGILYPSFYIYRAALEFGFQAFVLNELHISFVFILSLIPRDCSVGIALGYGLDDQGSRGSWRGMGIFFFATASRRALEST